MVSLRNPTVVTGLVSLLIVLAASAAFRQASFEATAQAARPVTAITIAETSFSADSFALHGITLGDGSRFTIALP